MILHAPRDRSTSESDICAGAIPKHHHPTFDIALIAYQHQQHHIQHKHTHPHTLHQQKKKAPHFPELKFCRTHGSIDRSADSDPEPITALHALAYHSHPSCTIVLTIFQRQCYKIQLELYPLHRQKNKVAAFHLKSKLKHIT